MSVPSSSSIEPCPRSAGRTERSATPCRSEHSLPTLIPSRISPPLQSSNVLKFSSHVHNKRHIHTPSYTLTYTLCTHTFIHPPMAGVRALPGPCIQTEDVAKWCDNDAADDEFRVPTQPYFLNSSTPISFHVSARKRKKEKKKRTARLNKEEPLA